MPNQIVWINLLALALIYSGKASLYNEVYIELHWDFPTLYYQQIKPEKGLYIDFYHKTGKVRLKTFLLLPWGDLYEPNHKGVFTMDTTTLYAVTPYAMIYNIYEKHDADDLQRQIIDQILINFDKITQAKQCNLISAEKDNHTLGGKIQVISSREFDYLVMLNVAKPGSGFYQPDVLKKYYPGKMLQIIEYEDIGIPRSSFVKPDSSVFYPVFMNAEKEIAGILNTALQQLTSDSSIESRSVYDSSIQQLRTILSDKGTFLEEYFNTWDHYFRIYLSVKEAISFNFSDIFGDYTPKTNPDNALDYMPMLEEDFMNLPETDIMNLEPLLEHYKKFKKSARKNPGKWVEGNMVLGASPTEYNPSKEELMLAEVGRKIYEICLKSKKEIIRSLVKDQHLRPVKINFTNFEFIHYDVMGSGRFFYVSRMYETKLNLKKL